MACPWFLHEGPQRSPGSGPARRAVALAMRSKYDQETKAKAIRLFRDHAGDYDSPWAAMCDLGPSGE